MTPSGIEAATFRLVQSAKACTVYILTHLLTPWSRVLFEKLTGPQLVKIFPAFYGNRMFITAFTSARHLSLSWARTIQSISHNPLPKIHLNIILPFTPRSSKWSLWIRFPQQHHVHTFPLPIRVTRLAHLILLDLITRITSIYKVLEMKPLFMSDPSVSSLVLKKRKDPTHERLCCFMNMRCVTKFKNRGTVNVILFIFYLHI